MHHGTPTAIDPASIVLPAIPARTRARRTMRGGTTLPVGAGPVLG